MKRILIEPDRESGNNGSPNVHTHTRMATHAELKHKTWGAGIGTGTEERMDGEGKTITPTGQ